MSIYNNLYATNFVVKDVTTSTDHSIYSSGDSLYYDGNLFAPASNVFQNTNTIMMLNYGLSSGYKTHTFLFPDGYGATTPPAVFCQVVATADSEPDIIPNHISDISTSSFTIEFAHTIPTSYYSIRALVFKDDTYTTFSGISYNVNPIWTNKSLFLDEKFGGNTSGTRENPNYPFAKPQYIHNAASTGDLIVVWPGNYSGFTVTKNDVSFLFLPQTELSSPLAISGATGVKLYNVNINTNQQSGLVLLTGTQSPSVELYGYCKIGSNSSAGYSIQGTGDVYLYGDLSHNRPIDPNIDLHIKYNYISSKLIFNNIDEMRDYNATSLESGTMVNLRGYYTENDGGQGIFWLDKYTGYAATLDNSGTYIKTRGNNYYWRREYKTPIDVNWFGVIGNGDSTKASYNSATLAYLINNFKDIRFNSTGVYTFNDTLSLKTGTCLLGSSKENVTLKWVGGVNDVVININRQNVIGNYNIDLNDSSLSKGISTLRTDGETTTPYYSIIEPVVITNVGASGVGLDFYAKSVGISHVNTKYARVTSSQKGKYFNSGAIGLRVLCTGKTSDTNEDAYVTAMDFGHFEANYFQYGLWVDASGTTVSNPGYINFNYIYLENNLINANISKGNEINFKGGDMEGANANIYGNLAYGNVYRISLEECGLDDALIDQIWINGNNVGNSGAGGFEWFQSASTPTEFYCVNGGGDSRKPTLLTPKKISTNTQTLFLHSGSIGGLNTSEWAWGDNDSLGFNTVYVRLDGERNPNSGSSTANKIWAINDNLLEGKRTIKYSDTFTDVAVGRSYIKGDLWGVTGYANNFLQYFSLGGCGLTSTTISTSGTLNISDRNMYLLESTAAVAGLGGYLQRNHYVKFLAAQTGCRVLNSSSIITKYTKDWIANNVGDSIEFIYSSYNGKWYEINRSIANVSVFGIEEFNGRIDGEGGDARLWRFVLGGVGTSATTAISVGGFAAPDITYYNAVECTGGLTITGFAGTHQIWQRVSIIPFTNSPVIVSGVGSSIICKTGIWTSSYNGDITEFMYYQGTNKWYQVN